MRELDTLYRDICGVVEGASKGRKTRKLLDAGLLKMAKKVGEEGVEVAVAAMLGKPARAAVIEESADLFFNLMVLWAHLGIQPAQVEAELTRRRKLFGIAEKPGSGASVDEGNKI